MIYTNDTFRSPCHARRGFDFHVLFAVSHVKFFFSGARSFDSSVVHSVYQCEIVRGFCRTRSQFEMNALSKPCLISVVRPRRASLVLDVTDVAVITERNAMDKKTKLK
ncbi:hypothetical protein BaRGS_00025477 [Batillaria attramentaria]|uniref:Uncharacterized protein n=1 Tax=Batillaria attramentaria TaxID=370345 RepID=A0ABD0K8B2_9CAEN